MGLFCDNIYIARKIMLLLFSVLVIIEILLSGSEQKTAKYFDFSPAYQIKRF